MISLQNKKNYFSIILNAPSYLYVIRRCLVFASSAKFDIIMTTGLRPQGWMDDLRFYVLFNSISVISGQYLDNNERLCAMELRLRLRRFHLE